MNTHSFSTSYSLFVLLLFTSISLFGQGKLLSPDEFLPHRSGEEFTPHHLLVNYFEHVAANSDLVKLQRFGTTYQGRPQMIAVVTSKENQQRLEAIRTNHLKMTGLIEGESDMSKPVAVVWLSYSVHGNEAAGSECSMGVLYELANPSNPETKKWLENAVVIIDPSQNPDGYDRYTHWVRNAGNRIPNPNLDSREHAEPWPGGRVNHYLFDLNRDWAWLTQVESQNRIKMYQEWMPHVHPDIHEQGIEEPYYFAPAAEPYHKYITQWQRDFQVEIGKNNARYFDKNGWLYFTKEVFDLFYPSYGDTYPTFNGGVGMTYEQAGISAGRAASLSTGDTLTLRDRVAHHTAASFATIEVSAQNATALVNNFKTYFDQSRNNPQGVYKTFIIKNRPEHTNRIAALCELFDAHKIRYGTVKKSQKTTAYDYINARETTVEVADNDLIVSAFQPKSVLAQVLLEPEAVLADSLTYDITAWSLPFAYGLEVYATRHPIDVDGKYVSEPASTAAKTVGEPYAFVATWNSLNSAAFLSELIQNGICARFASLPFSIQNEDFPAGTLIITRAENRDIDNWTALVQETARRHRQKITAATTGLVNNGNDFGSDKMRLAASPHIAVVYGESVDNNSYGFVWHYLERTLNYPFAAVEDKQLNRLNLANYNTLILTDGQYDFNDGLISKIEQWVNGGGKLILVGYAANAFAGKAGFDLKKSEEEKKDSTAKPAMKPYAATERDRLSEGTPGAIVKVTLDKTHPLAFGLGEQYYYLKSNSQHFPLLQNGKNVGHFGEKIVKSGFVGSKFLQKLPDSLAFGVEQKGNGKVIYFTDDPLFRGFWYIGKQLFSNALFLN